MTYSVSNEQIAYSPTSDTRFQANPWWGDAALAQALAALFHPGNQTIFAYRITAGNPGYFGTTDGYNWSQGYPSMGWPAGVVSANITNSGSAVGDYVFGNAVSAVTITAANGSGAVASGSTSSDSALTLTFTASGTTSDFTAADVTVSGATLSNFTGSGTSYTATLSATSASVTVDVGANKFTSNSLNNVASTQFTWTTSTDLIAPTVSSAVLAASGTTLTLTASETLGASTPAASAFTVSAGGSAISVSSVAVLGTSVTLSLAQAATVGQSISIAYTAPGTNDLQDAAGNLMVGFAGQSVTNSSTISGQLPSPITKADVVLSVQAQQKITSRASSFAMASVNNRLDWIRINPNITQRSFQGVKLSFANPLLNAVASQNYQNTSFGMEDVFAVGKQLSTGVTEDALAKINRCDRGCTG